MSKVKWVWDHEIRDLGCYPTRPPYAGHNEPVHIVPLADLTEVVEGLKALDRMCAAHKIQDLDAHAVIQRIIAQLEAH